MESGQWLGESHINRRPRRNEPFNPFAKDASQQHQKRRSEQARQPARRPEAAPEPVAKPVDIKADLERKQREAKQKLVQKGDVSAPVVKPAAIRAAPQKQQPKSSLNQSREERLADMRRKSEELKKAGAALKADTTAVPAATEVLERQEPQASEIASASTVQIQAQPAAPEPATRVKNVFRKIETKVAIPTNDRRRGKRRFDKKGGGRQKQERKLNRQKYLEYKYAAKDILDNPNVPEEHRSNVLGQVWAKGERIGIEESVAFIEQKELELILPSDVALKLRDLVKRMTTKR
ncbi:hypothetical protein [Poseidonia sp.]|uniref:hypothetical protein n=1 Tax=Poseidonia sp. TaxID=2666344 RepID=UPI003F69F4C6